MYNDDGSLSYVALKNMYEQFFSLGYITRKIDEKFAMISLICYITKKAKEKNSDTTYYQIIDKVDENHSLPDNMKKVLAVVCEDFGYGCKEFPLFGLKGKDIIKTLQNIFGCYTPF
jgi:hypothetical protein